MKAKPCKRRLMQQHRLLRGEEVGMDPADRLDFLRRLIT
jgi:hypothetical protein